MIRFGLLVILAVLVYSAGSWQYPIYILDEAKNAACAMEMADRNDWIVPTFNQTLRTDKPPLHYYFMRGGYWMFGVNAFGARFFSVVAGILTVMVVFLFTAKLLDEGTATWAALIQMASVQTAFQFHLAVPDPFLILFFVLGMFSFIYGWLRQKSSYLLLAYVSFSLAFISKGPVAIALAGASILLFLLLSKQFSWPTIRRLNLFYAAGIFVAIAAPWWVAVTLQTDGEWTRGFLLEHNVDRFTATKEGHGGVPGMGFLYFLVAMLPFSFFVLQSIWSSIKNRHLHFVFFCTVVTLVVVVFFSISRTVLPGYVSPAIPFASVVLAYYLNQVRRASLTFKILSVCLLLLTLLLPLATYIALANDPVAHSAAYVAIFLLVASPFVVLATIFAWRGQIHGFFYSAVIGYILLGVLLFFFAMPPVMKLNPVSQSLNRLSIQSATAVACYRATNPAYVFNLRKTFPCFQTATEVEAWLKQHPGGFILSRAADMPDLEQLQLRERYSGRDLFERHTTVVLSR